MYEIIETYWNVNGYVILSLLQILSEIIETYWNVNASKTDDKDSWFVRNNRNILECKFLPEPDWVSEEIEIIETYWNVN